MGNRLGTWDCWSWDDAVLGVCCSRCYLMIIAWRNSEGWHNAVSLGVGRVEHKKERNQRRWEKSSSEIGHGKIRVWVNYSSLIRQIWVPILQLSPPIPQLLQLIMQVVLRFHIADCIIHHLHPPSLSFLSTTLPSSQEHKVKSSHSISPCQLQELPPSASYTEYSIHRWLSVVPSFPRFRVDPRM